MEGEGPRLVSEVDEYITKWANVYLEHSVSYSVLSADERACKLQRFKDRIAASDTLGIEFEMSKIPYPSEAELLAKLRRPA